MMMTAQSMALLTLAAIAAGAPASAAHAMTRREVDAKNYTEVTCTSTAGEFQIELYRSWSPLGYDRFVEMVDGQYFDGQALWRAVPRFVVQFGIPATPERRQAILKMDPLVDDPPLGIPFLDGTLAFAGSGKNSRREEVFLSLGHQRGLGRSPWETPFGRITRKKGLESLHKIYTGYGDMPAYGGRAPLQKHIWNDGPENAYLADNFERLDYLQTCVRSGECARREDGWAICECYDGFTGVHCHTRDTKHYDN